MTLPNKDELSLGAGIFCLDCHKAINCNIRMEAAMGKDKKRNWRKVNGNVFCTKFKAKPKQKQQPLFNIIEGRDEK